ncbi:hypothetical protein K0M31_004713 [Melipona bicolor]|uniref:Uncharacterized protein n=1 Tax=Melipona bicolor TaxID=60889 RepID=A0AA40KN03_9HYME|nr:hypothetical protein K0M31_004713 [Melipona bicolor]
MYLEVLRARFRCTLHRHLAASTDDDAPAVRSCAHSCPFFFLSHTRSLRCTLDKTADPNGGRARDREKGKQRERQWEKDRRCSSTRKPKRRKSEKDGRPEMQHACINSVRASTRSAEDCRLDAAAAAIAHG